MVLDHSEADALKTILENMHNPEVLDSHPWVKRPFTREAVARSSELQDARPGVQLVGAVGRLFLKIMPGTPPRRGKRLDTRWGEFGLLAAHYFAPLQFGTPVPTSLRDAWGRIDHAILLYVFGRDGDTLSERDIALYRLVSSEPEAAPLSTLSDWHCKGIQRLAGAIQAHEQYLEQLPAAQPVQALKGAARGHLSAGGRKALRVALLFVLVAAAATLLILGGLKARRIYELGEVLQTDAAQVQDLVGPSPGLEQVRRAGQLLAKIRGDFAALRAEVEPVLWLGPWLRWVPVYGGDLAASRDLLDLADGLLKTTEISYAAFEPLVGTLEGDGSLDPQELLASVKQTESELLQARGLLDEAVRLRRGLDTERLSPKLRPVVEGDLDRLMDYMDDGLSAALALPGLLGASSEGPKTYLILAQNEDELRPTGGFITAAGTLLVEDGKVLDLTFTNSGELDNWDMPYPMAPWQLDQYMNSQVLLLRDANWFTDFPTTALYAESLYAYHNSQTVDGVIAFDQQMLVILLEAVGPVEVEGAPGPIDAGNVIAFMRSAKTPPAGEPVPEGWTRKGFMDKIATALLAKVFRGQAISWGTLGMALFRGLNEDHLLLVMDDPLMGAVLARNGWDGALRPPEGDYLMVVDANLGFNKTSAVVETDLVYDVDLTDPVRLHSELTVIHRNHAAANVACIHWGAEPPPGEEQYPINACYWNYMRVYTSAGTKLVDARAQVIPGEWMMLGEGVMGQVDVLDEEIEGLQAFGTLMVVPGGKSVNTGLQFSLPDSVLDVSPRSDQRTYRLDVRKQPGTRANRLTIRIHLPAGANLISVSPDALVQGRDLLIETNLRTDLRLEVVFGDP